MIYEVVVVGNVQSRWKNTAVIEFDELEGKPGWISRKKNIGADSAKYENLVMMHDYIELSPGWYEGYLNFGENFDICMNKIYKCDGSRFTDWTLCVSFYEAFKGKYGLSPYKILLPYDMGSRYSKIMYVSGAYFVVKKYVMKAFPVDEKRLFGESEDVEWSCRVRRFFDFSLNQNSKVIVNRLNKRNLRSVIEKRVENIIRELSDDKIKEISETSSCFLGY